ncbi:MAG: phytoene/squalene synthase family protein [Chthoniobacterales bacterium]
MQHHQSIPSTLIPNSLTVDQRSSRSQSNLAFALRKLPPDRRADALTFYDFCRLVDDIADAPGIPQSERQAALDAWKVAIFAASNELPEALAQLIIRHEIDPALLVAVVDGVSRDIEPLAFDDFEHLRGYCWQVASAVGLVSIRIFGIPAPHGVEYAENLGIALQLTNIIRDVGEDASNRRVYLPEDELLRFGVTRDQILSKHESAAFNALMNFQISRARTYYDLAEASAPRDWPDAMRPSRLMAKIYSELLDKIASGRQSVLTKRYRLSTAEKLWHLLRT